MHFFIKMLNGKIFYNQNHRINPFDIKHNYRNIIENFFTLSLIILIYHLWRITGNLYSFG